MRVVSPSYSGPALGGPGVCIQGTSAMGKLTPFMVAFWPLTEASGNRTDLIGGYTLTDVNTVGSSSDGLFGGNRALFVRLNGERLYRADGGSIIPDTGSFSISFWMEMDDILLSSSQQYPFSIGNGALGSLYIGVYGSGDSRGLTFRVKEAGGNRDNNTIPGGLIVADERIHVVAVYDAEGQESRLYITSPTGGAYSKTLAVDGTGVPAVATDYLNLGSVNGNNGLSGLMEQVIILSGYAVTATDVAKIYNGGAGLTFAQIQALT